MKLKLVRRALEPLGPEAWRRLLDWIDTDQPLALDGKVLGFQGEP